MSATADDSLSVYWCVICGPCLRETHEGGDMTIHRNIPHPDTMTFDEESTLQ